ncbi:MAG: hypothetical protein U1E52_02210 [Geminicoccaceae bacterium]
MTRDELIRRLRRIAERRGVAFAVDREHGKGSHWVVRLGAIKQTVPQTSSGDLRKGTLHGILQGFGLSLRDLE